MLKSVHLLVSGYSPLSLHYGNFHLLSDTNIH